jgi:hypothetical protein
MFRHIPLKIFERNRDLFRELILRLSNCVCKSTPIAQVGAFMFQGFLIVQVRPESMRLSVFTIETLHLIEAIFKISQ